MKRVAELARAHGVAGQAALETAMGCGYGACLGCAVTRRRGGYALCCKDGPVFGLNGVAW
jgi:dihydroorotate dehydrogenase electron transfer subunit